MTARSRVPLERFRRHEPATAGLLVERMAFLADANRVFTKLRAKDSFDEQNGLEGRDVDLVKQTLEAPANALPAHPERLMGAFAVRSLQHHVAGPIRLQLDP